jgi:hypothetical protein
VFINFFVKEWWISVILVELLILSDFWLTVIGTRLYKNNVSQYIAYENGYELNPNFEKEIAQSSRVPRKLIVNILSISFYLVLIGGLSINNILIGTIFEFLIGGLFLSRIDLVLLHLQNIWFFKDVKKLGGLVGHLDYSYRINQHRSAARLFSQAILFVFIALLTMRPFFWGGVFTCGVTGLLNLKWANRKFTKPTPPQTTKTDN